MAKKVAPPKNTGGGGFEFEGDVCAWLLACMLAGDRVFGHALGVPVRIDFQTRALGWFLDDVLVTTDARTARHRVALSVKSNPQLTARKAPKDFVDAVWTQWLRIGSKAFDGSADVMGLVVAPLSAAARASIDGLVTKARDADPKLFPGLLAEPAWVSEDQRALFASFACPRALVAKRNDGSTRKVDAVETARVLKRLLFVERDFGRPLPTSETAALELCRRCLRSGEHAEAITLWNALRVRAGELRPVAGHLTRADLIEELRGRFSLAAYPDHASDWAELDRQSKMAAEAVGNAIAGRLSLPRDADLVRLSDALEKSDSVVLVGRSGVGKSAIARALCEARVAAGSRTVWFRADAFEQPDYNAFEATLRLRHPLSELLPAERGRDPVLVIDGLDRVHAASALRNAALLLHQARRPEPAARWRVILPCQVQEWPRVQEVLEREGFVAAPWTQVPIDPLSREHLSPVGKAIPALAKLFLQPRIDGVLANLKILDLVARRVASGGNVDPKTWVGESSVAEWFWSAEIDKGANRIARGVFVRLLAREQGDRLLASVPLDTLGADLAPLASLDHDRVCVESAGRLAFGHDLLGDWVRLRILIEKRAELAEFLKPRRDLPLWHRALRLYGIHLLEHDNGVEEWRKAMSALGTSSPGAIHDVLLEAPVFAANAGTLLAAILPDLLAKGGALLRRFLTRFLFFATLPDQSALASARALGVDLSIARSSYRVPYWPYWLDVLRFLHEHRALLVPLAASQIARVVDMWQSLTRGGTTLLRREVASTALLLGERAHKARHDSDDTDEDRQRFYRCALAAASEFPTEVADLAKHASERVPAADSDAEVGRAPTRRRRPHPSLFPPPEAPVERWPDGPRADIDEAFRSAVLEVRAIEELVNALPAIAREVVLASLIDPPDDDRHPDPMLDNDLELASLDDWQPGSYAQGPFLVFLRANFTEGLELVVRLVDFATSRWCARAERNASALRALGRTESPEGLGGVFAVKGAHDVVVPMEPQPKSFHGGEHAYLWSSGNGNAPVSVQTALAALEQHFYSRLDAGEDIAAELEVVFARGTSAALLSVLCAVGKRHDVLFEGPLRPLLMTPELYSWDISTSIHGQLPFGMLPSRNGAVQAKIAHAFFSLPHRKILLRDVLRLLTVRSASMREYFSRATAGWVDAPAGGDSRVEEMRRQVIAIVTPEHYEVREHPEHGQVLVNAEEERVFQSRAEERRIHEDNLLLMSFPHRCQRVLEEGRVLAQEELEATWVAWQKLRELARSAEAAQQSNERFGDEFANAILGGVAVFLSQPAAMTTEWPRRAEVLDALRAVLDDPPARGAFDNWESPSISSWDAFAAESLVTLWVREPSNVEWRRGVATLVFAPHFATVSLLFARCARHRKTLGADFSRLRRLALEWAYVWDRVDLLRHVPPEALGLDEGGRERAGTAIDSWVEEKIAAFADVTARRMPVDWAECNERQRFVELDAARRRWVRGDMNFKIVRCAHAWLPLPNDALDEEERAEWIQFWRTALARILKRPQAFTDRSERHYPDDEERWVLQATALLVLQLREVEGPGAFWQPILDLVGEGHDWPEIFLRALHHAALAAESVPATYVPLLRRIVARAFVDVDGKKRWRSFESVWDSFLAMDGRLCDLWEPRHRAVVAELADVWDVWKQNVVPTGRRLAYFANSLLRPAAEPLRLDALPWILSALGRHETWREEEVREAASALGGLLDFVWQNDEAFLRAKSAAFEAFRKLLSWLCDRQNPRALELLGRIGGLG